MEENNYISLIHKSLTEELTASERVVYESWLENKENKELAQEVSELWAESATYVPSFQPNTAAAFGKFRQEIKKEEISEPSKVVRMNPFLWVGRIAAALVILVAALFVFNNYNNATDFDQHHMAEASIEKVLLDDGSSVWLDKNASLAVSEGFGNSERLVKLEGKAFFEVARDEAKPFIVQMGQNTLEVLGTSFNIDNTGDLVEVDVRSGVVKVKAKNAEKILNAGESAVLNYALDKIDQSVVTKEDFIWFDDSLSIHALSIKDAVEQIESHFEVNISLSPNVDKSCKLTSPLLNDSTIDEVFEVLKVTYNLKYEKLNADSYEIKLLDCK